MKGGVIAVAMGDLFHGTAKQHHGVGRHQACRRREGEFALAGAEFDFDRPQRQAERDDVAPDDLEHRLHLVVALLGQVLIALRQQAHGRRLPGLAGILGRHPGIFELEDVAFDFEPGDEVIAAPIQCREHLTIEVTGRERHRPAVGEIKITQ
jgi:hypothetical protein